jgi:hypothetical protein
MLRDRRQQEASLEEMQPTRDIRPRIETMPGAVEMGFHLLRQVRHSKSWQDALEIAPVQHIELRERDAAGTHLLHGRLVLAAPGVGEGRPVRPVAERFEHRLRLPRDAAAPVDQGAEHVEKQRFHFARYEWGHRHDLSRFGWVGQRMGCGRRVAFRQPRHVVAHALVRQRGRERTDRTETAAFHMHPQRV